MEYINSFLMKMSPGAHKVAYFSFHAIAFIMAILYIILHGKRYKLKRDLKILLIVIVGIMGASVQILYMIYEGLFGVHFRNLAHTFLLLGPLTWWFSFTSETPARRNLDIMGPMFLIAKGVSGLGCLFWGCCCGVPVDWGIYSYQRDTLVVPMQAFEFAAVLILVLLLNLYEKNHNYDGRGMVYGYSMFGYGIIRFLTDILKDNSKLVWNISVDGIFATLFIIAGLVDLIICSGKPHIKERKQKFERKHRNA